MIVQEAFTCAALAAEREEKMRKKLNRIIGILAAAALTAGALMGCGGNQAASGQAADISNADQAEESRTDRSESMKLEGTITMAGSTSMEKLANAAAESFMEEYPSVMVTAEFTGSSAGIEAVLANTVDIGNSSRNLKDSEKEAGAVENIVAIDGIAVVVDSANTVTGLTRQQLIDIYTGKVKNWSEVGGEDGVIIVVGREAGSGTRGAFEELLEIEDGCKYANELDSTGAVMAKVASTPGAVGYVSLDVINDSVKALSLEGVEPTEENIKAGAYFLSRPFVMATAGAIEEQSEAVQAFFSWLFSERGQEVVKAVGLITVD